jgi:acyl dehydratase
VDNIWFTCLTLNTNQVHFNTPYAERTQFGKPLVNSAFTLALSPA